MSDQAFRSGEPRERDRNRVSRRKFLGKMVAVPGFALAARITGLAASQRSANSATTKSSNRPDLGPGFSFTDVAAGAGLRHALNVYGGIDRKRYILEETGCGVALFDYDNDGWLDIFFVNGTRSDLPS